MSSELFEAMENQGLISGNKVNLNNVKKLSTSEIIDFVTQTRELTSSKHMSREKSPYAFSSSISLGGGASPCSDLNCRLDKAKNLAQFSALYSDRIYINYYPNEYLNHLEKIETIDKEDLQIRFANDLRVLSYFRPLIESQKVIPITHPNYCPHCLAITSFGKDAEKRFNNIFSSLTKRYNKEMIVAVEKKGSTYGLGITASEELLEHGFTSIFSKTPFPNIEKMPEILSQLHEGKIVILSPSEIRKLGLAEMLARRVRRDLGFELASTQSINTNFLTDRDLDIEVLKDLSGDPTIDERNHLIQKYLTCLVPFIENAKPADLLTIRQNEGDSFITFRKGLNQVIDEYRKQRNKFTENDAREIYGDIIEPKLAQLNIKVNAAQKSLVKNTASKIIGWAGAISLGWYAGLLPADLATAATALGLIKIVAELTENTLTKSNTGDSIRDEPMYYLWKVKKNIDKNA